MNGTGIAMDFSDFASSSNATLKLNNFSDSNLILRDISVSIEKGDFICLCGPNGAGKSTLLRCLRDYGIISPENCTSPKERSKLIAFLTQNEAPLWNYSVFDTVLSGRFPHTSTFASYSKTDMEIADQAIQSFGLEKLREKSILEISGGEFQKVRIARCFAQDAEFLLLDEPLSSLDFVFSHNIMKLLKEKCQTSKKGAIISVHDLNMAAAFADKIILLGGNSETANLFSNGKTFVFGKTEEVFSKENISKAYNAPVKICKSTETGFIQVSVE